MIPIPSLSGKTWAGIALAVIVAAACAYHYVTVASLESQVATLAGEKAKLEARNLILTDANQTCAASVINQNQAITDLLTKAKEREQAALAAIKAAEQKAAKHLADADALLKRPMPKPGDECGSLEVLINEMIEGRAK